MWGRQRPERRGVYSACFPSNSVEIPPPAEFKKLVEYCSEKKLELLVGSNANAHHTVKAYLGRQLNRRGSLWEYLMAQGLLVQNEGKAPMFITRMKQEVLDLTICSMTTNCRTGKRISRRTTSSIMYDVPTYILFRKSTKTPNISSYNHNKTKLH